MDRLACGSVPKAKCLYSPNLEPKAWKTLAESLSPWWRPRNTGPNVSEGNSGSNGGQSLQQRQNSFLLPCTILSGLLPECATHMGFPTSIKASRRIFQLTLPIEVILVCGKLTLKPTLTVIKVLQKVTPLHPSLPVL